MGFWLLEQRKKQGIIPEKIKSEVENVQLTFVIFNSHNDKIMNQFQEV